MKLKAPMNVQLFTYICDSIAAQITLLFKIAIAIILLTQKSIMVSQQKHWIWCF